MLYVSQSASAGSKSSSSGSNHILGGRPSKKLTLSNKLLIPRAGSSSSGSGSDRMSVDGGHSEEDGVGSGRGRSARGAPTLNARELGAPDCMLVGADWRIAAHRCAHQTPFHLLGFPMLSSSWTWGSWARPSVCSVRPQMHEILPGHAIWSSSWTWELGAPDTFLWASPGAWLYTGVSRGSPCRIYDEVLRVDAFWAWPECRYIGASPGECVLCMGI